MTTFVRILPQCRIFMDTRKFSKVTQFLHDISDQLVDEILHRSIRSMKANPNLNTGHTNRDILSKQARVRREFMWLLKSNYGRKRRGNN